MPQDMLSTSSRWRFSPFRMWTSFKEGIRKTRKESITSESTTTDIRSSVCFSCYFHDLVISSIKFLQANQKTQHLAFSCSTSLQLSPPHLQLQPQRHWHCQLKDKQLQLRAIKRQWTSFTTLTQNQTFLWQGMQSQLMKLLSSRKTSMLLFVHHRHRLSSR